MDNLRYYSDNQLYEQVSKINKNISIESSKLCRNSYILDQLQYYKQNILDEISQRQYNVLKDKEQLIGPRNLTHDKLSEAEDQDKIEKQKNIRRW